MESFICEHCGALIYDEVGNRTECKHYPLADRADIKIKFNTQKNGACPLCKMKKCYIKNIIRDAIRMNLKKNFDNVMELVIYRCPEFKE